MKFQKGNKRGKLFSKDYQPDPEQRKKAIEARKEHHRRKRLIRDILKDAIKGELSDIAERLSAEFGVEVDEMDVGLLAHLQQLRMAIYDGDTKAYVAVMDRIEGKPVQKTEILEVDPSTRKGLGWQEEE